MKVGGASGVEAKARRGDEPATAILSIDEAVGLQLHQRLADGDPGGAVEFPQQPLGGELVVGGKAPRQDLVGEGILDLQVLGFAHGNPWLGNGLGTGRVTKWRRSKCSGRYQCWPCCSGFLDYRDPGAENEFFVARGPTPLTLAGQLPTMCSFWYIPNGAKS